jgi:hypothetical protein
MTYRNRSVRQSVLPQTSFQSALVDLFDLDHARKVLTGPLIAPSC